MTIACNNCGCRIKTHPDRRCACGGAFLIVEKGWSPLEGMAVDQTEWLEMFGATDRETD